MNEFGYKVKRGTEEDWATYLEKYKEEYGEDYIPSEGKLLAVGFVNEDDGKVLYKLKVGNGTTTFDKLPYTDEITSTGITIEELQEEIESKQDKLVAGENIVIDEDTNVISAVGGSGGFYTAGDGIDITSSTISVKKSNETGNLIDVDSSGVYLYGSAIASDSAVIGGLTGVFPYSETFRQRLVDSNYNYALASKSYVDNLLATSVKWEFVSQLPTEDIDKHTIYFVPKQNAETDNIYDEWVYALVSTNPDTYDWELIGSTEVDLSNYYTKSQTYNKTEIDAFNANDVNVFSSQSSSHKPSGRIVYESGSYYDGIKRGDIYVYELETVCIVDMVFEGTPPLTSSYFIANPIEEGMQRVEAAAPPTTFLANNGIDIKTGTLWLNTTTSELSIKLGQAGEYPSVTYIWHELQHKLTPYEGIDITNYGISVALSEDEGNIATFDLENKLYVPETDLSTKQDVIDSSHKLSADLLADGSTNKPSAWNNKLNKEVVNQLPTQNINENTIYLVPKTNSNQEITFNVDTLSEAVLVDTYASFIGISVDDDTYVDDILIYLYDDNNVEISHTNIYTTDYDLIDISKAYTVKFKQPNTSASTTTLTYRLMNSIVRERELADKLGDKQDTIDSSHKLSADLLSDGSTNKPSYWNAKSKIFDAVMSGGGISTNLSDYPNIQYGDIAIKYDAVKTRVWVQATAPSEMVYWSEINYSQQKITQSENTPTASAYGGYTVGDMWVQKITSPTTSYKVFILVDIAQTPPPKALTWTNLTDHYTKSEVDTLLGAKQDTIDSTHKLSADNVDDTSTTNKFVPSHSSSESGKVLGVDTNGDLEWATVGSSSSEWTLIKSVNISELAEPVYVIDITEDSQGNAFAYDDIFIVFTSLTTVNANQNLKHAFRVQDNHYAGSWVGGVIGNAVTTTARNFYVKEERELETMWTETRSSNGTVSSFIKTADWANGKKIDEIKVESDTFSGGVIDFYGRNKQ